MAETGAADPVLRALGPLMPAGVKRGEVRRGGRPVVVAGHSWGGLLAQLVAIRHPELVPGLVLLDPVG